MKRKIDVASKARADVRRNASWLQRTFSKRTAEQWNHGIIADISTLALHPEQHPLAEETIALGIMLRCKLHGRRPHVFRILFTVTDDSVQVLRVRHAAQDRVTEDDL